MVESDLSPGINLIESDSALRNSGWSDDEEPDDIFERTGLFPAVFCDDLKIDFLTFSDDDDDDDDGDVVVLPFGGFLSVAF